MAKKNVLTAKAAEVGPFLNALRSRTALNPTSIAKRYQLLKRKLKHDPGWASLDAVILRNSQPDVKQLRSYFEQFERCEDPKLELDWPAVALLARIYDQRPLMLSALFSQAVPKSLLVGSLRDYQKLPLEFLTAGDNVFDGEDVQYAVPQSRLTSVMDINLGQLTLQANGKSDFHEHTTGDELVLMLEGSTVELGLGNSGVRVPLREREFVHFRGDLPHRAINRTDVPARLFVIRINQLYEHLSREFMTKWILDKVAGRKTQKLNRLPVNLAAITAHGSQHVTAHTIKELQSGKLERAYDVVGLAVMLQSLRGATPYDDLQEVCRAKKLSFSRTRVYELHTAGAKRVSMDDIRELATLYNVPPILMFPYVFPAEPDVVAIYQEELIDVPAEIVETPGIRYRVPIRRLALSDLDVLMLSMDVGKSTVKNEHPGYELVIPIGNSRIEIELDEMTSPVVDAVNEQYAYFPSGKPHVLRNVGNQQADVLVFRFHKPPQDS